MVIIIVSGPVYVEGTGLEALQEQVCQHWTGYSAGQGHLRKREFIDVLAGKQKHFAFEEIIWDITFLSCSFPVLPQIPCLHLDSVQQTLHKAPTYSECVQCAHHTVCTAQYTRQFSQIRQILSRAVLWPDVTPRPTLRVGLSVNATEHIGHRSVNFDYLHRTYFRSPPASTTRNLECQRVDITQNSSQQTSKCKAYPNLKLRSVIPACNLA